MNQPGYITNMQAAEIMARLGQPYRNICYFMLHTGARISDTLSLRTNDIKGYMWLYEVKTRKKRPVRLNPDVLQTIKAHGGLYYAFEARKPSRRRFEPKRRCRGQLLYWLKPVSRQIVDYQIRKAARAIGATASSHSFRHLYARNLYEASGGNIEAVRKAMNHVKTETTEKYIFS